MDNAELEAYINEMAERDGYAETAADADAMAYGEV